MNGNSGAMPPPKKKDSRGRRGRRRGANPRVAAVALSAEQLLLHLKQRRHKAAILGELSNVVVHRFCARRRGAPDLSVRGEQGVEPADVNVVLEIAAELRARADEEHRAITMIMKKSLNELRAADCPVLRSEDDEDDEESATNFDDLLAGKPDAGDGG